MTEHHSLIEAQESHAVDSSIAFFPDVNPEPQIVQPHTDQDSQSDQQQSHDCTKG